MPNVTFTESIVNTPVYGVGLNVTVVGRTSFHSFLEQDLEDVFFNNEEFAVVGTYTHTTGESYNINVIYDDPHTMALMSDSELSLREVFVKLQERKLKRTPNEKDTLRVNGITYNVKDYKPDGVGVYRVLLVKSGNV